jgi:hypothetical protein
VATAAEGDTVVAFSAWTPDDWAALRTSERHRLTAIAAVLDGLRHVLPSDAWHLKGSAAAVGWVGPTARMPNDVDLAVAAGPGRALLSSAELPSVNGQSNVLRTEPVVFHRRGRADVHRVLVHVRAGDTDEHVLLNVLLAGEGHEPAGARTAPLAFPGGGRPVPVPATTFSRGMAQKVLRYTRRRPDKANTRWVDLADLLLAAACRTAPPLSLAALRADVALEFAPMGREWPQALPGPPAEWLDYWDTAVFTAGLPFGRLPEAADRLAAFWDPVLRRPVAPFGPHAPEEWDDAAAVWSPDAWSWLPEVRVPR